MKHAWLLALALLGPIVARGKPATDAPLRLDLSWRLSMDAQGHVTALTAEGQTQHLKIPEIRQSIEQRIRTWQFAPGTLNGKPAPTQTTLKLDVSLLRKGSGQLQITFDTARTGGEIARSTPPFIPPTLLQNGFHSGLVVLRISYDADGNPTKIELEPGAPRASKILAHVAIETVKRWSFRPEKVSGHGVPGTELMPMCIFVTPVDGLGRMTDEPKNCDWTPPNTTFALSQGDSLAINPIARLLTEITDHGK